VIVGVKFYISSIIILNEIFKTKMGENRLIQIYNNSGVRFVRASTYLLSELEEPHIKVPECFDVSCCDFISDPL
jgi:hypothetical protein